MQEACFGAVTSRLPVRHPNGSKPDCRAATFALLAFPMKRRPIALLLVFASMACGSEPEPFLEPPSVVVPGSGLPPEINLLDANNNLDVVAHEGRIYFAFRTA